MHFWSRSGSWAGHMCPQCRACSRPRCDWRIDIDFRVCWVWSADHSTRGQCSRVCIRKIEDIFPANASFRPFVALCYYVRVYECSSLNHTFAFCFRLVCPDKRCSSPQVLGNRMPFGHSYCDSLHTTRPADLPAGCLCENRFLWSVQVCSPIHLGTECCTCWWGTSGRWCGLGNPFCRTPCLRLMFRVELSSGWRLSCWGRNLCRSTKLTLLGYIKNVKCVLLSPVFHIL